MPRTLRTRRKAPDVVAADILAAAVGLFSRRGYEATTMQDVADAVGITAPAIYYHFDSKPALLFEVIERNLRAVLERIETGAPAEGPGHPAAAALEHFVRTHIEFQIATMEGARIYNAMFLGTGTLHTMLSKSQRQRIAELQRRFRDRLDGILARGVAAGEFSVEEPTVVAMGIIAFGEFVPAWYRAETAVAAEAIAGQYASLAVRMVRRDQ